MRRSTRIRELILGTIIMGGFLALGARAGGPGPEAALIALSDAWIAAEVNHDRAALEQLLDERFLATFSSGKTIDRTAYIGWIMSQKFEPFTVLNDVVQVHGETALVIATTTDRSTKFTWIAVRKKGRWRVISETFSKVAAPK